MVLLFLMSPPDVAESHETPLIHFISYLFSPLLPSSLSFHSVRYECHKPFFHNNNNKNKKSISGIPTYSGQFYLKPAIPLSGLICWYLHHQLILIWSHWKLYCIISAQLWLGCSRMVTMAE